MNRRSTIVLLSILALAFACTNDPFDPDQLVNTRPVARIFVASDSLNSTSYNNARFHWSGTDVDGFVDGANGNSAGYGLQGLLLTEAAPNTVTGYTNGKIYGTATDINATINDDADAAKIRFIALCVDMT